MPSRRALAVAVVLLIVASTVSARSLFRHLRPLTDESQTGIGWVWD